MTDPVTGDVRSIALCLSGGGLRATLFHLGVLRALRRHRIGDASALSRVLEIYSVSGGSITAAHFLRNHDRYTGTDAQFAEVERELIAFSGRDIRDRVLRRWALSWWAGGSRSYWLGKEYEALLGDATIGACYRDAPAAPTLHILATNFGTGELCSFSRDRFEKVRRTEGETVADSAPAGQIPLAYAVAASSSFPPMFPPVTLTPQMLGSPEDREFASPIALSDGGVYDNFGIDKFRLAGRTAPRPALLVVSHAGGSFDTAAGKSYSSMLSRNIRASDIMMRRVGDSTLEDGEAFAGAGYTLVRIGATVDDGTVEVSTQQLLRLVRTDLNAFDADLSRLLVDHGHRVASAAFAGRGWETSAPLAIDYDASCDRALERTATRAAQRSVLPLLFDFRDFAVLALWWLLALSVLGAVLVVGFQAYDARAAREAARAKAEKDLRTQVTDFGNLLERVRAAVETGDIGRTKRTLAGAIETTEQIAADLGASAPTAPVPVSAAEAERIVEGSAPLPELAATARRQRVFIQFAGTITRAQITALNVALTGSGWRAQGASGERTPAAAGANEVRYSGDNRTAAIELAAAINRTRLAGRTVEAREVRAITADVLEVWISN